MKRKDEIYTNCYDIVKKSNLFFFIFIGGRGIGKTYSMLRNPYFENKKIMYVRRTETELKNCCSAIFNPYKKINMNEQINIEIQKVEDSAVIIDNTDENNPETVGYASALSTFGKFRGADFSDVDLIVYDEFISTSPYSRMENECLMLLNFIETVNRNRELEGEESVKVVLLSNANTIDNDIIRTLGLAEEIHRMKQNDEHIYTDEERGIYLNLLENKEVLDMKMKTRLYKLAKGTSFYDMALDNEFTRDYFGDVGKVDYKELVPMCCYENFYIYEHKSNNVLFISKRKCNCPKYNQNNVKAFKRAYGFKIMWYIEAGYAFYADYGIKLSFLQLMQGGANK